MIYRAILTCILVLAGMALPAEADDTVEKVLRDGRLRCGVHENLMGFAVRNPEGRWSGFTVDFCRAVAAAVLGDGQAVDFMPLSAAASLPTLLAGKVDLLAAATMTFGREAAIGVEFPGVYYLDGLSLIVQKSSGAKRIEDLSGATVCVQKDATGEKVVKNAFESRKLAHKPLVVDSLPDLKKTFLEERCQALIGVRSALLAFRVERPKEFERFEILPGYFSKEPMGPVVRRDDERWTALVRWVLYALIEAEEEGIGRNQVSALKDKPSSPAMREFLVESGTLGKPLGLRPDWVARTISAVGNYGEMFDRNLGADTPIKIDRAYNRLWKDGGLLYAPPFR